MMAMGGTWANGTLAARAADPFDSAPMLARADRLEGMGDLAGTIALRGLAGAGIASLHALALDAALVSVPRHPDELFCGCPHGFGDGSGDGSDYGEGRGTKDCFAYLFMCDKELGRGDGDDWGDEDEEERDE